MSKPTRETCRICHGSGWMRDQSFWRWVILADQDKVCPSCNGRGWHFIEAPVLPHEESSK